MALKRLSFDSSKRSALLVRRACCALALALLCVFSTIPREAEARQTAILDTIRVAFQDGVAPSLDYAGTRDTKLRSDAPSTPFGDADFLEVDAGPDYTSLIRWDLSSIPDSAIVLDATLVLNVTNVSTASYQLYTVSSAWDESDATWIERSSGQAWSIPGASGEQDRSDLSLSDVDGPVLGEIRIPLSSSAITTIQEWVSDPIRNHGFIVQNYETADDGLDFASREATDPSHRPRLEVGYHVGPITYLPDPPQALFDVVNERGSGLGLVSVDGAPSYVPGTAVVSWQWDFGDGFQTIGTQATHTYSQPGTYEIELTVTDSLGAEHSASRIVIVDDAENAQASFQQGVYPLPSYEGATDAKLQSDDSDENFGNDVSLFVDGSPFYSTLMRWELTAIAPGIEVAEARLTVDVVDASEDEYDIYPLLSAWDEDETTWDMAMPGTPWAVAGAADATDRLGESMGTFAAGAIGPASVELNDVGRAWIARWINEPSTNHGFVIQNFESAEDGIDFRSSEAADSLSRPRLDLSYRVAHHASLPEQTEFGIWPNPFRESMSVNIASDLRHSVELELYDPLGRRVLSQTIDPLSFGEVRLDTSFLAAGVYALILTEHGSRFSRTRMVAKQ